ncbi:MAG TPA: HIT domain-containing protein [Nitrospirota bacterium]|nr:HIT domain-containing protein [Nitrospirota bacterium]
MPPCPFCSISSDKIIAEDRLSFTVRDTLPVSPGHTLILPKRHIASIFEATKEEVAVLWKALQQARSELLKEFSPDGFNIGINDGLAAGQTILHLHIHLIPRYKGDMPDPRGGIRWIFPEKAVYWKD